MTPDQSKIGLPLIRNAKFYHVRKAIPNIRINIQRKNTLYSYVSLLLYMKIVWNILELPGLSFEDPNSMITCITIAG